LCGTMEYSDSDQDSVSVLPSVKIHLPSPTRYIYEESAVMFITRLIYETPSSLGTDAPRTQSPVGTTEALVTTPSTF
jgi:hypothetical protein